MSRILSAIIATMAFAASYPASATVIYSGLKDISIPANFDGIYLDVDTGATGVAEFAGWDINPFFGGDGVANSPAFQPARTGTNNFDRIIRLNVGDMVNASRLFSTGYGGSDSHLGSGSDQFGIGQDGYLGFKVATNSNAGPYYGWMRVVFTANTSGAVIKDWAYETTAHSTTAGRILESSPSAGVQTVTLSGGNGETYTLGSQLADHGGNATAVLKTGDSRWTLTGTKGYTGTTTVGGGILEVGDGSKLSQTSSLSIEDGAELLLSGTGGLNSKLNPATTLSLDGGTLDLGGLTGGIDQQVGALGLDDHSILDFGTLLSGATFRFGDSSGQSWTAGRSLSIWNWTDGVDHLYFGDNSSGLLAEQLGQILFFSDSGNSLLAPAGYSESSGEVEPIPEAATGLFAVGVIAMLGWRRRALRFAGCEHRVGIPCD